MRNRALLLAALLCPALTPALELAGVEIAPTAGHAGKTLVLNGAGLRKRFIVKVYVGALYLESRSTDPEAIVAADGVKVVRMTFLRDVDKAAVLKAFREGFEKNSKDGAAAAIEKLAPVDKALPDEIKKAQVLLVAYAPGVGATVGIEGGPQVTVEGKAFADALLRNWLGPQPADDDLKSGMLGK